MPTFLKPNNDLPSTDAQSFTPSHRFRLSKLTKVSQLVALAAFIPLFSQAALPESVQAALTRAAIKPSDISIVITPIGNKNSSHLPPVIRGIDQQAILQRERELNAYTDDPYTHLSLERTASVLPSSLIIKDADVNTDIDTNIDKNTNTDNIIATPKTVLKPLVSHKPDTLRTPASTMKLVPSFIALDTLGADFVWHTRVYHTGIVIGNRLYGDLIIQGSGDPKMTHGRLQEMLLQVKKAGINHINGDIIIDSAVFENVSKNPAAFDYAPLRSYNASPDGFLVNFSSIGINSYPLNNGQARLTYTPQLLDYQLPKVVNTRSAYCGQANQSLSPQWQTQQLALNANLPKSCGEHVFYIAYPDAKDFASRLIATKWQQLGNTLTGEIIAQETPYLPYGGYKSSYYKGSVNKNDQPMQPAYGLTALAVTPLPIVSYPSLSLQQQIYDINHFSNNVMTEQVALSIGAYEKADDAKKADNTSSHTSSRPSSQKMPASSLYQFGKPQSTDYSQALQSINQWWQTHLTTPPPYLTNGSGLCRDCTISAANLNELLNYAYDHPSFDAYVNSLGVAGVSGTIVYHSERLPESAAIGRAWIKTGTLNNVTAMAGYVKGQSGQDYTVVGLINTEQALNPYIARPVLDAMLDWTAQQ